MKRWFAFNKSSLILLIVSLILTGLGLIFVFEASASESFELFGNQYVLVQQHLLGLAIGIPLMLMAMFIPSRWWIKISPILFITSLVMLVMVLIPAFSLELNGAKRWISLGGVRLQPVEFLKFSLIAFFARWLAHHQRFGPFVFLSLIPASLIILQPDLGSLLLVLIIATIQYFLAGGRIKKLMLLSLIGLPLVLFVVFSSPYRRERVKTFINPESDPLGSSFQIRQITLALGRGGWFGQGIGNSNQKYAYIPEASSDSIFAIVAEEVGFLGSSLILILFITFLSLGWRLANQHSDPASRLLGIGCITWISTQTLLNLAAVAALVPLTGMPLPFFSYGRSSQIMIFLATGYLIGLGKKHEEK